MTKISDLVNYEIKRPSYSPFGLEMTKQVFRANQDAANVAAAIALENRTQILSATQLFATSGKTFADAVGAPKKETGDER
jgi:hypothetical protein